MEFASYGQSFNTFGGKKDFPQVFIYSPKRPYKSCPKGAASINN